MLLPPSDGGCDMRQWFEGMRVGSLWNYNMGGAPLGALVDNILELVVDVDVDDDVRSARCEATAAPSSKLPNVDSP